MALTTACGRIGIFDTALHSNNLGDVIIMDAVWSVIHELFGERAEIERVATHSFMPRSAYRKLRQCSFSIVGGTNILKSHMFVRGNWRLRPYDMFLLRNIVLLGVGWQQYQKRGTDILSKMLFGRVLSRVFMHSVRDEYTLDKMHAQVRNILYTACPTLWSMSAQRCAAIPTGKSDAVIFSLTHYRPDRIDAELIDELLLRYRPVYFWCQQDGDRQYLDSLRVQGQIAVIDDIGSFNRVLDTENVDVIGTRLHGGIRALQRGRRSLILAVDNRAMELARSTNIPVVDRHDLTTIRQWIDRSPGLSVTLPWDAIGAWKGQFADVA